jgi:hypothetical protein
MAKATKKEGGQNIGCGAEEEDCRRTRRCREQGKGGEPFAERSKAQEGAGQEGSARGQIRYDVCSGTRVEVRDAAGCACRIELGGCDQGRARTARPAAELSRLRIEQLEKSPEALIASSWAAGLARRT